MGHGYDQRKQPHFPLVQLLSFSTPLPHRELQSPKSGLRCTENALGVSTKLWVLFSWARCCVCVNFITYTDNYRYMNTVLKDHRSEPAAETPLKNQFQPMPMFPFRSRANGYKSKCAISKLLISHHITPFYLVTHHPCSKQTTQIT